ncbi:MAG: tetratricopeptide repeat protein [Deltaproteobacteria bacterium]|nr:tetratricopeptide repeat protein [Deltaproteobacteria bacterium]
MKRDSTTRSSDSDKASSDKLKAALKKVEASPADEQAWDEIEALAADTQKPDDAAAAYRKALAPGLKPDAIVTIGQRALRFLEEWYAGETEVIVELLETVLKLDPAADWALERLTILRSVNQQWDALLAAYDRVLDGLADGTRRRRLLRDAASVARDSGGTTRAAAYLLSLFEATPGNVEVSAELEHLLERQGDFGTLARVLEKRLTVVSGQDALELGTRLGGYYVDKLAEPAKALDEIEKILTSPALADDAAACALAERVLGDEKAPAAERRRALGLLRTRHVQQGRLDRMVAALRVALSFAAPGETRALVNEAADMLERQGDLAAAREQLVELVACQPEEASTRARLKFLAEVTSTPAAYVRGLCAAAEATKNAKLQVALWLEAAAIEEARSPEAAVDLYRKPLASPAADKDQVLTALRKLGALLEGEAHADERLDILERQASLEPSPGARRGLLGEAADLARARDQIDRALALWGKRLAADPNDRKALSRTIEILEEDERWSELVAALARRADAKVPWIQRRADLLRIAEIEREQLQQPAEAIAALAKILETAPGDSEAVATTLDLFADAARWQELLNLGAREGKAAQERLVALFVRLGEACAKHLDDAKGGALWYGRALAIEPRTPGLRDALFALLDNEAARAFAVEGIVRCCGASDDWRGLLDVLPHRLALAASDGERARLHREAAGLEEKRGKRLKEALGHPIEIIKLLPEDPEAEAEIVRLAGETGEFTSAARALEQAGHALPVGSPRKVYLLLLAARFWEEKVRDEAVALSCFEKAFKAGPTDRGARLGVVRLASQQGGWQAAVDAALAEPFDAAALVADYVPLMEQAAKAAPDSAEALALLGKTLSTALGKKANLPPTVGRAIEERIADYAVGSEKAAAWQEKSLLRARDYDPTHLATLRRLADVQKSRGGKPLVETLMQIAQLVPRDLDAIAAALAIAESEKKESSLLRAALTALFDRAAGLLRAGQSSEGKVTAADAVVRAAQGLASVLGTSRDKNEVRRALDCLLEASRLPIAADAAQALRARAGELAADVDKRLARELLRQAVDQDPKNRSAAKALAKLYEEADLLNDLLVLRRRELEDAADSAERIELRLEIARLGEIVENRTGRFEILLANLEDSAGHPATLAALGSLLRSRGRYAELADILVAEARKLEEREESQPAARLWGEAAVLFEKQLSDHARAISAYEMVVKLGGDPAAMEALARLNEAAGEPLAAANWLEQRLSAGAPSERREAVAKLAQTYLAGGQRHRAVAALERALGEDGKAATLWNMLASLHREAGHHEALLRVLAGFSAQVDDAPAVVAAAEEALALCKDRLCDLAQAVPILERAVALAPEERALKLALAEGMRVSGRFAEARTVLEGVLQEYGRRQSRERAALHLQIATVARAEKDLEVASKHLEQAAAVLLDSMDVQLALAEVAEERGDLERAEKAYRALLVLARRGHAGDGSMTAGEVLVRLRRLALRQGQHAQAAESLESIVARALHDPAEARCIQAALLADEDSDTLLDLLGKRRASAASVAEEALVVCELATALDKMGRAEEGLVTLLDIITRVPDSAEAHSLARGLAARLGKASTYLETVASAADKLRRADDAGCMADLLLRAADVAENDLKLLDRAQAFLRRAEQTGRRGAEVGSALAKVAAATGDASEQGRAIAWLRRLAEQAPSFAEKGDLYYRLAEAQLASAETRDAGLDALAQAVELRPDLPRATAIVQNAKVPDEALARVLPVYEKVARAAKDERVLLDFLERRAAQAGARLADVREGVELAVSLGEGARAERLLARAIEIARTSSGGLREAVWAIADLSRRLRARGDMAGAARVLDEARDEWANPRLTPLVRETAKAAAASRETATTAARLYEQLHILYPTDRDVWEPLLDLLARLGDRPALQVLVEDLVEKLMSRTDRGAVRMAWARYLQQGGEAGEATSAALRDVLLEEPGHPQALMLLADIYEQRGDVSEAVTLLTEALSSGEGAASSANRASLARRLGDLVKKADPAQAKEVYRSALSASLPEAAVKRSLQLSLAELLTGEGEAAERAALLEEILRDERDDSAVTQAIALFELRVRMSDEAGAERALALGRERAPGSAELFDRASQYYIQRERWADLAELCVDEAGRESDAEKAGRLLRRAAQLQRQKAGEPGAAARTLRRAAQLQPANVEVVRELCDALAEAGDPAQAVAAVGEILAVTPKEKGRVELLRLRADLAARAGDDAAAAADLEEAFDLGARDVGVELATVLSRVAELASGRGDKNTARVSTLRLAEVLRQTGEAEQADQVLFRWIETNPDDREVLLKMRDIFTAAERWEAAANVWARLVHIEEGEAKAAAVLALTDACEKLGRGEEAIPWLAGVLGHVPAHRGLQARLAALYAATGNVVEAARLRNQMADSETDENERFVLYVQIGQSLLTVGEGADAVAALEKAAALPAADRSTRRLLLEAYTLAGAIDRAQALLAELLAEARNLKPEELALLYQRQAGLAAVTGDRDGQLAALKKALDSDRKNVVIANELADLAESIGDDDVALRALRVVAANPVKDAKVLATAYLRQARIAYRAKDRARAIIFVKRALQEDATLEEAKALLDQLK